MQRSRRFRVVASAAVLAAVLAIPATGSAANPAGNNGTVKVHGVEFDRLPHNQPHVGCEFWIAFYGFDEDPDLDAHVTFEAQPPTGTGTGTIAGGVVPVGEDSNAGGGSEAGWDAEQVFDLGSALAGYEPHPTQGYHVKLTVEVGAATKHKTFWVTECDSTVPQDPGTTG